MAVHLHCAPLLDAAASPAGLKAVTAAPCLVWAAKVIDYRLRAQR